MEGIEDDRRALGAEGETRAAAFLERRGYRIESRNVRLGGVEVDLIAKRGALVVLVEVKTRRSAAYGGGELAVDAAKQRRLVRAGAAWLRENPGRVRRFRFDVITCRVSESGQWQIEHWPGAFDASD